VAHRLPQAPHLAVTALAQDDVVPVVGPFPTGVDDLLQARPFAVELHPLAEVHEAGGRHRPEDAHGILALHLLGGVHQGVGQLPIGGEEQEAAGVEV
jgi:hypothetical protein